MTSKRKQQSSIEAEQWWTTLREGELSRADRERFVDWLQAAPKNVSEYLELADFWRDLGAVGGDTEVEAILAEVETHDNIVPLSGSISTALPSKARTHRPWLAAAACALVVLAGALALLQPSDVLISTAVGEQRSITLADGSLIKLNTRTTIRHRFDESTRRVELIEGEALFDVARDEQQPFIVTAGATEVRVLGTSFNVYKQSDLEATVSVLEGRVTVRATGLITADQAGSAAGDMLQPSPSEVELTDGQQIHIRPKEKVTPVKEVPPEKVVEWTTRRITFENTALSDVVAEFNRYNTSQLRVDDPDLALLELNGVFKPHSQDDLLEYLQEAEDVRIHRVGDQRVISR